MTKSIAHQVLEDDGDLGADWLHAVKSDRFGINELKVCRDGSTILFKWGLVGDPVGCVRAAYGPDDLPATIRDYQALAMRTMNPNITPIMDMAHCTLGIIGELSEVYEGSPDWQVELGDVLWYIASLASRVGLQLESLVDKALLLAATDRGNLDHARLAAGMLAEVVKKQVFYRGVLPDDTQPYERLLVLILNGILGCLVTTGGSVGGEAMVQLLAMARANHRKLTKKYKQGFTIQEVDARDQQALDAAAMEVLNDSSNA